MAPNIFKELKGVNFSCASPASTSIEQQLCSMRMSLGSSGRAIDRFSPQLRDPLRAKSLNPELTTTRQSPRANNKPKLSSKSSSSSSSSPKPTTHKKGGAKEKATALQQQQQLLVSPASSTRFLLSGSASDDLLHSQALPAVTSSTAEGAWRFQSAKVLDRSTVTKAVLEPSRFQYSTIINVGQSTTAGAHDHESSSSSSSSFGGSSSAARPQNHQVVVLRVSLHCKGCEAKVRKHLSKMEGHLKDVVALVMESLTPTPMGDSPPPKDFSFTVTEVTSNHPNCVAPSTDQFLNHPTSFQGVTSFTTELLNKKVTVIGDVTPLGVLNSISKVKNAQLWRSFPPSTTTST